MRPPVLRLSLDEPGLTLSQQQALAAKRQQHAAWCRMQREAGQGNGNATAWDSARKACLEAANALTGAERQEASQAWHEEHTDRTGRAPAHCDPRTCPYGGEP